MNFFSRTEENIKNYEVKNILIGPNEATSSVRSYTIGFILSIVLTVMAYLFITSTTDLSESMVLAAILWCAIAQALVQMVFFLHLGAGKRPRWRLSILVITIILLFIVVGGSMWIMAHLNGRMMLSPEEMNGFMLPLAS